MSGISHVEEHRRHESPFVAVCKCADQTDSGGREKTRWQDGQHHHHCRCLCDMLTVEGSLRWSGQYGSFGEVRHQTDGFTRLAKNTALAHQPLRYAGQYADSETGLHYNLFRYYDPQAGRFNVQDPIGFRGGLNLYVFSPNSISWIDPLGLSAQVTFTDSRGLTLDVSGYTDLTHLSDSELNRIIFMNGGDAPHPFGLSPRDKQGNTIVLHHDRQQSEGPLTAMPDKHHGSAENNAGQHPKGNAKGAGINNRREFNLWKKEFWKAQAEKTLGKRRGGCV